jgi:hypothetical protein
MTHLTTGQKANLTTSGATATRHVRSSSETVGRPSTASAASQISHHAINRTSSSSEIVGRPSTASAASQIVNNHAINGKSSSTNGVSGTSHLPQRDDVQDEHSDSDNVYYTPLEAPEWSEIFMFFSTECSPPAWCIGPNLDPKHCKMMCMDAAESPAEIKAVWLEEAAAASGGGQMTPSELRRTDMDGTDRFGNMVVKGGYGGGVPGGYERGVLGGGYGAEAVSGGGVGSYDGKYVVCKDMVVTGIGLFEFCRRCIRYVCVCMYVCMYVYGIYLCVYVCIYVCGM